MDSVRIRPRQGTAAWWASNNEILSSGEHGYETDNLLASGGTREESVMFKIGDGVTHWNDLPYEGTGTTLLQSLADISARAATTANLTATYANGASGVGRTLTATTNVALPAQDTISLVVGQELLVWKQTAKLQNGVYTVTSLGVAGVSPWILTGEVSGDTQAEIDEQVVFVILGTLHGNKYFTQQTTLPVVGTDNIVYKKGFGKGTDGLVIPATEIVFGNATGDGVTSSPNLIYDGTLYAKGASGQSPFYVENDAETRSLESTEEGRIFRDDTLYSVELSTTTTWGADAGLASAGLDTGSVYVGNNAGLIATSLGNVAIGFAAGSAGALDFTIAIGYFALNSSSGYNNVGIGDSAGYAVTTGRHNVLIGGEAGYSQANPSLNTITGSYNICIGDTAVTGGNAFDSVISFNSNGGTGSNQILFGGAISQYTAATAFYTVQTVQYSSGGARHSTYYGTVDPNGVQVGNPGDHYLRNDGTNGFLYLKDAGVGTDTDWVALGTGGGGSYTDEDAQDAVGSILSAEFTYDDPTPGISINSIVAAKISDFTETAQDVVGAMFADDSTFDYNYNDGTGFVEITIKNDGVSYAQIQNVSATDRLLGRVSAGAGNIEEIPITDFVQTILDDTDAATVRTTIGARPLVERVVSMADATSFTMTGDTADINTQANTQAVGTLTANAPSGTPTDGQSLILRIISTNIQTFSWDGIFQGSADVPLPTATTGGGKYDYFAFRYNSGNTKWNIMAINKGF